ncbi:uncharacterized protein V1518DRAFT_425446 [Limtongia smithiae]|uniref:uncharacterized protein n=1 Tax=Limtongia smithiae TaxID=1125753 RepID=UPI0034D00824
MNVLKFRSFLLLNHAAFQRSLQPYATSSSKFHDSLASFLIYARQTNLSTSSTYYVGTCYEYAVLDALKFARMSLERCGGTGDNGIDLRGTISLAAKPSPVLVQCKHEKTKPGVRHIRELEGACAGYSADTLGVLAARWPMTTAAQRTFLMSDRALMFTLVTPPEEGATVKQMIWNNSAQKLLKGLSVVSVSRLVKDYGSNSNESIIVKAISLVKTDPIE